ncbi:MAG: outer membrane beta-barrel protein [Desulfobacterales bacterium]|nr:outer membrane beta-barrel protein [Desulfobacterales bacterium]MDD3082265.1 outer membrane beta-barrel protein [Desulfobacterales bacterium]MDD3952059.1 outer membrane beta-barrel protein [Desulfobacterales bacterium]MDD4464061.1 outer membrane beta-barrel protein [Desulfobacterales bacterium]
MKQIISSVTVLFLAALISSAPVNTSVAGETGPLYIGVVGGYAFGSDLEYKYSYFPSYDLDIQNTWTLGAKIGYTMPFARAIAVEFEYLYFGPDVDRTVLASEGDDFYALEGDLDVHNFMFNFIAKYPEGRFHPFLGIGLGVSDVDFSGKEIIGGGGITDTYSMSYDDTAFAWQIFAGVNCEINRNFSVDLAYRFFMTDTDDDYEDYYYYYGTELEIESSIVTVGLNYHF